MTGTFAAYPEPVDVKNATWKNNSIGSPELAIVWQDPDFNHAYT